MNAFRRAFIVTVLVILLGFAMELLQIVAQQFRHDLGGRPSLDSRVAGWSECSGDRLASDSVVLQRRQTDVDVRTDEVAIRLTVDLDARGKCAKALAERGLDPDRVSFLQAVVGALRVDSRAVDARGFTTESINVTDSTVRVVTRVSTPVRYWVELEWNRDSILRARQDSVVIRPWAMTRAWTSPAPVLATDSLVVYLGTVSDPIPSLRLGFRSTNNFTQLDSYGTILERIGHRFPPLAIARLFFALATVAPLLLFLGLAGSTNDDLSVLRYAALAGVSAALLIGVADSVASWDYSTRWFPKLSEWAESFLQHQGFIVDWRPALGTGFDLSLTMVLMIAVPAVLRRPPGQSTPRRSLLAVLLLAAPALAAVGLVAVFWRQWPVAELWMLVIPAGLVALALTLASLTGVTRIIRGTWLRPGGLVLTAGLAMVLVYLARVVSYRSEFRAIPWFLVILIIGWVAVSRYWELFDTGMRRFRGPTAVWSPASRRVRWSIGLFLALPLGPLLQRDPDPASAYHSSSSSGVATMLLALAQLCWVLLGLAYLHHDGRDVSRPSEGARVVGVGVMATLLFPPSTEWLGIPLTFGVGALIVWWLLIRFRDTHPVSTPRSAAEENAAIADLIALRLAEQGFRSLRRSKAEQLRKSEVDMAQYTQDVNKASAEVEVFRARIRSAPSALERGPRGSAWENGVYGAAVAGVLALPWLILGLQDLLAQSSDWLYPHWSFAYTLLNLVARWVAPGFLLGYFFPVLPGRTGLGKALILCGAWIAPLIPFIILDPGKASATLVNAAQAFVHLSLLGMFGFDFAILRSRGQGDWRAVFDLHGLAGLGVSVSTLLLALGTAGVTLVTGKSTEWLTDALRLLLPTLGGPPTGP